MRKPVLLIFANACILIIIFVLLAQSLFVVHRVALARHITGQVSVQRGGSGAWTPLMSGASINRGDLVRTADNGWAEFAWQDGTRWKLWPQSQLAIHEAQINPIKKTEISEFELESGQVLVRVVRPLQPSSRFQIRTPHAVASVRGTIFCVSHQNHETAVKVHRGAVDVVDTHSSAAMHAASGQVARVSLLESSVKAEPDQSVFLSQPSFLQPYLQVDLELLDSKTALLKGQTEVGNRVTVGGRRVPVLGTGHFRKRVDIGFVDATWKVTSTDKHGAQSAVLQRLPNAYDIRPR